MRNMSELDINLEGIRNKSTRFPIIVVTEDNDSLHPNVLHEQLQKLLETIGKNLELSLSVEIGILRYSQDLQWVRKLGLVKSDEISYSTVKASGAEHPCFERALLEALTEFSQKEREYKLSGINTRLPMLVLFTTGDSDTDLANVASIIGQYVHDGKLETMVISNTDNQDVKNHLQKMATSGRICWMNEYSSIVNLLVGSMVALSTSTNNAFSDLISNSKEWRDLFK